MGAIQGQQQSASQSANQQPKAQANSNIFTSSSSFLDDGRPVIVPRVPPLLPNRVTLASFRKLLLHRRKLEKQCTEWKQALSNNQNGVETRSPVKVEDQSAGREGSSGFGPSVNTEINPRKSSKSLKITSAVSSRDYHDTFEYKMLSARFNSLFVWPAFLATFSARRPRKNRTKEELMKSLSCADVDLKEDYPESKHTNKKNRKVRNLRKKKIESVGDVSAKKVKHKKKGSVANESFPAKRRKVSRKCDEFEEITRHKSARKESVAAKARLTTKRSKTKSKTARKRNCRDPTYEPPVNIKTEIKEEVDY